MATQGYIYATIHNDGTYNAPLPAREVYYGECCGSVVVQTDWAFVFDCLMCRQPAPLAVQFDVYPHGISVNGYATNNFGYSVQDYLMAAASRFIDKALVPSDGAGQWANPTYQPVSPNLLRNPKPPKSLDTMRRLFYDCKQLSRWRCSYVHDYQRNEGDWAGTFPSWTRGDPPLIPHAYYDPTDNRRDPDALTNGFSDLVRNSSGWSINPAYAVIEFHATKLTPDGVAHAYKHIVKTMNSNGKVDASGWTSHDCEAFANSQGMNYCEANVVGEYYDVTLPHDSELVPWHWEPTS